MAACSAVSWVIRVDSTDPRCLRFESDTCRCLDMCRRGLLRCADHDWRELVRLNIANAASCASLIIAEDSCASLSSSCIDLLALRRGLLRLDVPRCLSTRPLVLRGLSTRTPANYAPIFEGTASCASWIIVEDSCASILLPWPTAPR